MRWNKWYCTIITQCNLAARGLISRLIWLNDIISSGFIVHILPQYTKYLILRSSLLNSGLCTTESGMTVIFFSFYLWRHLEGLNPHAAEHPGLDPAEHFSRHMNLYTQIAPYILEGHTFTSGAHQTTLLNIRTGFITPAWNFTVLSVASSLSYTMLFPACARFYCSAQCWCSLLEGD